MNGPCAFCGHPNWHRIVDRIEDRIRAGEPKAEVLADYGYTEEGFADLVAEAAHG